MLAIELRLAAVALRPTSSGSLTWCAIFIGGVAEYCVEKLGKPWKGVGKSLATCSSLEDALS